MADVDASTVVAAAPDVLVQRLPDGDAVFLDLVGEEYYALDPVGAAMWSAVTSEGRIDLALAHLLEMFDTDEETLSRDLTALVANLVDRGLLVVVTEDREASA